MDELIRRKSMLAIFQQSHSLSQAWDGFDHLETVKTFGEWIPISERLPENGQSVLFCDIDNDIMIGYHVKGRPDTHFSQDGTYEDIKDVRAWMPLPERYKEGG